MVLWLLILAILALEVIAYLIMPKPKGPKPASAKDLETPTAEAGRPIPVVFGTMTIKSPNVLWYGDAATKRFEVEASSGDDA